MMEKVTDFNSLQSHPLYKFLLQLPTQEAALLELYYVRKLRLVEIADLLGKTLATSLLRLQCAQDRLNALKDFWGLPVQELLSPHVKDPLTLQILTRYCQTASLRLVAWELGIPLRKVARKKAETALYLLDAGNCVLHSPLKTLLDSPVINTPLNSYYLQLPPAAQKILQKPLDP